MLHRGLGTGLTGICAKTVLADLKCLSTFPSLLLRLNSANQCAAGGTCRGRGQTQGRNMAPPVGVGVARAHERFGKTQREPNGLPIGKANLIPIAGELVS